MFKIHTPIVSSQFRYFQIYPIPIQNQTIIPEQPYLLLNTENYWTTSERCPEVEDQYFCLQSNLHKHQPCLADLIKTGKNSCPGTKIYFSETSTTQINSKEVLVIPATSTNIKSWCDAEGIYEVNKPCVVSLSKCRLSIENKYFQAEQSTHEEYIFELPKVEIPEINNDEKQKVFHLKKIDNENIKQINTIATNLQIGNLHKFHERGHPWINTCIILVAIITILAALYYMKIYRPRRQRRRGQVEDNQKTIDPLFSALGREELCSQ